MATEIIDGQRTWSMTRDDEGHRDYKIAHLVRCDYTDGPANVINTAGLPLPGSVWNFDADYDPWAFCRPTATVSIHMEREGDPANYWKVEQTFSTRPLKKCQDTPFEDPLLEPIKISGTFSKYQEEATHDRYGMPVVTSSFEQIRGPSVEFDRNRPTVRMEMNVAGLNLGLLASMVDNVNDAPLWGLLRRCVKLSNVSWEQKYYGQCYLYYTLSMDFDINFETFDRELLDEGYKVLNGEWDGDNWVLKNIVDKNGNDLGPPDFMNPAHYDLAVDKKGNPMKILLNGEGLPATSIVEDAVGTGTSLSGAGIIRVEKYVESNLLLLGIPVFF